MIRIQFRGMVVVQLVKLKLAGFVKVCLQNVLSVEILLSMVQRNVRLKVLDVLIVSLFLGGTVLQE